MNTVFKYKYFNLGQNKELLDELFTQFALIDFLKNSLVVKALFEVIVVLNLLVAKSIPD